jgi:hypothetical protein
LRHCCGPARRDGVAVAAVTRGPAFVGTDGSPSGVAALAAAGSRVSASVVAGFWTPAARSVLNPHASIGIYGHEPGAGQCAVRMFVRFRASRRRDGDCLKIVVSPVRFRASHLHGCPANRGICRHAVAKHCRGRSRFRRLESYSLSPSVTAPGTCVPLWVRQPAQRDRVSRSDRGSLLRCQGGRQELLLSPCWPHAPQPHPGSAGVPATKFVPVSTATCAGVVLPGGLRRP